MQFDLAEAKKHLRLLEGSEDSPAHWQIFFDPRNIDTPVGLACEFYGYLESNIELFNHRQANNCGVFLTVNKTDGKGRHRTNITETRFCFSDWDGIPEPKHPVTPSFQNKRDDFHGHTYFRLNESIPIERWQKLQRRISMHSGSDPKIYDPSRVLRLAGSVHCKDPNNKQMYRIFSESDKSYSAEELENAFKLSAVQEEALDDAMEKMRGDLTGIGYDNNPIYQTQFLRWAQHIAPPAILGSGSQTLYNVCLYGKDRGLSIDHAKQVLWDNYNERCEPPWTPEERSRGTNAFDHIIERAYLYSHSVAGCKTFKKHVQAKPSLPPRIDGWRSRDQIIEETTPEEIIENFNDPTGLRITEKTATLRAKNYNSKTSDYELAVWFDGLFFDGNKLLRTGKIFYVYDDGIWRVMDDDVMKSKIQRSIAHYNPANKKVQGVFNSLCDHVNREEIQDGTWLNNPNRDGSVISVYNNCMVDISTTPPTEMPHTPEYFTYNKRDYNWDANATCPKFDAFLESLWSHDRDNILMLFQCLGYQLTPDTKLQKAALFVGLSGAGKGVLVDTITKVIGESNCASPPLNNLHKDNILASIRDKAALFINDARTPKDKETAVSILLQLIGQDSITTDVKFKDAITFKFSGKVNMTANMMPDLVDGSGALSRRLIIFKFKNSFQGKENFNLREELESELAGIAARAIREYQKIRQTGQFIQPRTMLEEAQEIKDELFKLSGFVNDFCKVGTDVRTSVDDLYRFYLMHCTVINTKHPMSMMKFTKELKVSHLGLEFSRQRGEFGRKIGVFDGIKIKEEIKEKFLSNSGFSNRTGKEIST